MMQKNRRLYLLFALLIIATGSQVAARQKWALIIGLSTYPQLESKLPKIRYAETDAQYIYDALTSEYCEFEKDKIILLTGAEASHLNILRALEARLQSSQPEDLVFIFFAGHGFISLESQTFYWLCSDSRLDNLPQTALSIQKLAKILKPLPAQNFFICMDTRRSSQSLGPIKWDLLAETQKKFCILDSSHHLELTNERGGRSLFTHFLLASLRSAPYLGKYPDLNQDGLITVTELGRYLPWAMRYSGIEQHPVVSGELPIVLARAFTDAHLQVITPRFILENTDNPIQIAGFIRAREEITAITVGGQRARWGLISQLRSAELNIKYSPHFYWFAAPAPLLPGQQFIAIKADGVDRHLKTWEHKLHWRYRGWHNEWMPCGLIKGKEQGTYIWQFDGSKMVYVPADVYTLGIPPDKDIKIQEQITQLRVYLEQIQELFKKNRDFRKLLVGGLEQSNQTLVRIGKKLQSMYQKVDLLEKTSKNVQALTPAMESPVPMPSQDLEDRSLREASKYFIESHTLLEDTYRELRTLAIRQYENSESILYLQMLEKLQKKITSLWRPDKISLQGFYIDKYEVSNQKYLKFCSETSRPQPPDPWWQRDYIWNAPEHPIVNVSWEDAMAYCIWTGKQLPLSRQWEAAARGKINYIYPWGNHSPYREFVNAEVPVAPENFTLVYPSPLPLEVNSMPAGCSPFGCRHMAGNVWEWCLDAPSYVPHLQVGNQQKYRIAKGGSFTSSSPMLASWFEHPFSSPTRRSDLGFRCVINLNEQGENR